jgi:hypothetical protein
LLADAEAVRRADLDQFHFARLAALALLAEFATLLDTLEQNVEVTDNATEAPSTSGENGWIII